MSQLDWAVMIFTLVLVVAYGYFKSKTTSNLEGFLKANKSSNWLKVCFSVMATQASAITFLSVPGQAYTDGLRFIQFYFGLPLAMIVICYTFIPTFRKWNVFTAYEYLETRFDSKSRLLTSLLFLIPRGLSTGVAITAPTLILSVILGWPMSYTAILMGILIIGYCVIGGIKGVIHTQMLQMSIVLLGIFGVIFLVLKLLPAQIGFGESVKIAGHFGKLNAVDLQFDINNRYNIWSGIVGGFFLQLSYFGTDQSQVGRYLTASSTAESRWGLLANGLLKIPMQFLILFTGVMVFVFYQFNTAPVFFNETNEKLLATSSYASEYQAIKTKYNTLQDAKKTLIINELGNNINQNEAEITLIENEAKNLKSKATLLLQKVNPNAEKSDSDYIFLGFITHHFPKGLVGLVLAMVLLSFMSSVASAINALTSCSLIDIYQRYFKPNETEGHYYKTAKIFTIFWGVFCVAFALFATKMGNLIEVVNILGSWFYGPILGIFLVAFYFKKVNGTAVFYGAILAEALVLVLYYFDSVAFLWLTLIGALAVIAFAYLIQNFIKKPA